MTRQVRKIDFSFHAQKIQAQSHQRTLTLLGFVWKALFTPSIGVNVNTSVNALELVWNLFLGVNTSVTAEI